MKVKGYIKVEDLYNLSEKEVIQLIKNCEDTYISDAFTNFENATRESVYKNDVPNENIYCTSVKGKKRYINPLVCFNNGVHRIKDISDMARTDINEFLNMKVHTYIGFDFDFKP